jgi:hypothetical protein
MRYEPKFPESENDENSKLAKLINTIAWPEFTLTSGRLSIQCKAKALKCDECANNPSVLRILDITD